MHRGSLGRMALGAAAAMGIPVAAFAEENEKKPYASGDVLGRGVRLQLWKAKHENVVVLDFENPALQFNITRLRDRNCTGEDFVHYAVRTFSLLLDFALCELIDEDEEVVVETASGVPVVGSDFPEPKPLFSGISIQRNFKHADALARDVLSNGLPPGTVFGSIRLAEKGLKLAKIESSTLPSDLEDRHAILLDPEFSSLDSIETAIRLLLAHGVPEGQILVLSLLATPDVADAFCETFPQAKLVVVSFDEQVDESGEIIPGLGRFYHRYEAAKKLSSKFTLLSIFQ